MGRGDTTVGVTTFDRTTVPVRGCAEGYCSDGITWGFWFTKSEVVGLGILVRVGSSSSTSVRVTLRYPPNVVLGIAPGMTVASGTGASSNTSSIDARLLGLAGWFPKPALIRCGPCVHEVGRLVRLGCLLGP